MRALVTGANGFLGQWLCRRLLSRGDSVVARVRRASDVSALVALGATVSEGDLTRSEGLRGALQGVDVVFHLAGLRKAPAREPFFEVNAEGTRHICEAMLEAGARRLALCSSLGAMGPSTLERPHVESDPFRPTDDYGASKAEGERIAWTYAGRLEVTVLRPPRIFGPEDRENLPFVRIVRKGWMLDLSGPPRPLSIIDIEDTVTAFLLLADSPRAVGEAYFVEAGTAVTLEHIQRVCAQALGVKPRSLKIPETGLRALAVVADGTAALLGRTLPLSRSLARQLLAPAFTCSAEKLRTQLGFKPAFTADASIARAAKWYLDQGWL
jgi:dihydroflavonol-4-reductase